MSRLYGKNRDLSRPVDRIELTVQADEEDRLDRFLADKLRWRSRTGVRKLVEQGVVSVNGTPRKSSTRLKEGDVVAVEIIREDEGPEPEPPPIEVLFEDEHMMALNKAAGTVVHPVGVHQRGTLLQELHRRHGPGLKLAHRLDQHTSGVLLVAKSDAVRTAFSDMLERGEVGKIYQALLLGRPEWDEVDARFPIAGVGDSRILMCIDEERGKEAHSRFRVRARYADASHVEVEIFTGRTHQIRIHAAHLGHPLVGDHLYGDGIALGDYERFVLHAWRTRFAHPVTGAEMELEAPLPAPFEAARGLLRR
ncbi:MAG: RluA family pseudouridine synthase [Planctomycetota bacterium]|jgi:RluA family pseudouridine synthase